MLTALIVIGIFAVLVALFTLIGGYFMYRFATVRDKSGKRQVNYWEDGGEKRGIFAEMDEPAATNCSAGAAWIKGAVTERVYITSRDGIRLCGHIVENNAERGVAVLMHGYRSCGLVDFSLSAKCFYDIGFTLLIPDQRGNGESGGKHICFGVLERYDAVDWANYAAERWGQNILMCGVSLGASTVMMACGVGYPREVKAILADCGYSSPGKIAAKCLYDWYRLPKFPVYYGAVMWIKVLAHFDFDSVNCRDSLAKLRGTGIKLLVVHGTGDKFVPHSMSEENIRAFDYMPESARREVMEFLSVDGAGHGTSFVKDKDAYIAALGRLFDKAKL